jgi:hypothetical protein
MTIERSNHVNNIPDIYVDLLAKMELDLLEKEIKILERISKNY